MERRIKIGRDGNGDKKNKGDKGNGVDGIPGKVWKYEGEEVREWLGNFCRRM